MSDPVVYHVYVFSKRLGRFSAHCPFTSMLTEYLQGEGRYKAHNLFLEFVSVPLSPSDKRRTMGARFYL